MRLETKMAAVIVGVIAIGMGVWYIGSGGQDDRTDGGGPGVAQAPARTAAPGGEVTDATARGPDEGGGSVGSPASVAPREGEEESLRPRPMETLGPTKMTLPTRRTGLAGEAIGRDGAEPSWLDLPAPDRLTRRDLGSPHDKLGPAARGTGTPVDDTAATRPAGSLPVETSGMTGRLTSPSSGPPEPVSPPQPAKTHVIQPGDTFSSLAARYFGHAKYMNLIMQANPDRDPRRLHIGSKVTIPPPPAGSPATPFGQAAGTSATASLSPRASVLPVPPGRAYTVQPGEGWYRLAQRFLGKGSDWPELYELNRERVSANRNLLRAGTVIELPARAASTTP